MMIHFWLINLIQILVLLTLQGKKERVEISPLKLNLDLITIRYSNGRQDKRVKPLSQQEKYGVVQTSDEDSIFLDGSKEVEQRQDREEKKRGLSIQKSGSEIKQQIWKWLEKIKSNIVFERCLMERFLNYRNNRPTFLVETPIEQNIDSYERVI